MTFSNSTFELFGQMDSVVHSYPTHPEQGTTKGWFWAKRWLPAHSGSSWPVIVVKTKKNYAPATTPLPLVRSDFTEYLPHIISGLFRKNACKRKTLLQHSSSYVICSIDERKQGKYWQCLLLFDSMIWYLNPSVRRISFRLILLWCQY